MRKTYYFTLIFSLFLTFQFCTAISGHYKLEKQANVTEGASIKTINAGLFDWLNIGNIVSKVKDLLSNFNLDNLFKSIKNFFGNNQENGDNYTNNEPVYNPEPPTLNPVNTTTTTEQSTGSSSKYNLELNGGVNQSTDPNCLFMNEIACEALYEINKLRSRNIKIEGKDPACSLSAQYYAKKIADQYSGQRRTGGHRTTAEIKSDYSKAKNYLGQSFGSITGGEILAADSHTGRTAVDRWLGSKSGHAQVVRGAASVKYSRSKNIGLGYHPGGGWSGGTWVAVFCN